MILSYVPEIVTHIKLYCGDRENDSAVRSLLSLQSTLPFTLEIIEIPRSIIPISASDIREYLVKNDLKKLEKYLSKNHTQCYLFRLLQSYSLLLQYSVCEKKNKKHKGMVKLQFGDLRSTSRQNHLNELDKFKEWCMKQR